MFAFKTFVFYQKYCLSQRQSVREFFSFEMYKTIGDAMHYPIGICSLELFTYSYVTHEDICDAFGGDTLLAVMAPSGTQLEVPVPEMVCYTNLEHNLSLLKMFNKTFVLYIYTK